VAAGLAGGTLLQADRHETSALARAADPAGGLDARAETWRTGFAAAFDRPLTGYGPSRYGAATGPRRTLRLARLVKPDGLYNDAHNLLVEYAATTGLVGLGLFAAWAALASRAMRPLPRTEFLVPAALLAVFHMVEPLNVVVTPLMAFLAGAAVRQPREGEPPDDERSLGRGAPIGVALGVIAVAALGARTLVGDIALRTASLDYNESAAEQAETLLWPWAGGYVIEARIHIFTSKEQRNPAALQGALRAARAAAAHESDDPRRFTELAGVYYRLERFREAAAATANALAINPWSAVALDLRAAVLTRLGQVDAGTSCRSLLAFVRGSSNGKETADRHRAGCLHSS
jgi:tetratricopeptide (TPR) repeat protein